MLFVVLPQRSYHVFGKTRELPTGTQFFPFLSNRCYLNVINFDHIKDKISHPKADVAFLAAPIET